VLVNENLAIQFNDPCVQLMSVLSDYIVILWLV